MRSPGELQTEQPEPSPLTSWWVLLPQTPPTCRALPRDLSGHHRLAKGTAGGWGLDPLVGLDEPCGCEQAWRWADIRGLSEPAKDPSWRDRRDTWSASTSTVPVCQAQGIPQCARESWPVPPSGESRGQPASLAWALEPQRNAPAPVSPPGRGQPSPSLPRGPIPLPRGQHGINIIDGTQWIG